MKIPQLVELGTTLHIKTFSDEHRQIELPDNLIILLRDGFTKMKGKWIVCGRTHNTITFEAIINE